MSDKPLSRSNKSHTTNCIESDSAEIIDLTDEQTSSILNESSINSSNQLKSDHIAANSSPSTSSSLNNNRQQNSINLASIAPSPPKFVAMDEIMKAANGVTNMYLSHQICLNENFKITRQTNEHTLRGQVESAMKKAYWKIIESQLNTSPPVYKQTLALLQEIKDEIFQFILPQHSKLKQEIDEVFDLDLIKQQTEYGAIDLLRYGQYILSVLARLCAPVRDEKIKELSLSKDLVYMLKGIMDLIDLMKSDMANYHIQKMRPQILQHSVEYEKEKFREFLNVQAKMNIDGLVNTTIWLKRNFESLDLKEESKRSIKSKVLLTAYIEFLQFDQKLQTYFPETVALDEEKIKELQIKIHIHLIVGSVILVVFASINQLQNIPNLKSKLKSIINILFTSDMNLSEKVRLENIALQLIKEIEAIIKKQNLQLVDQQNTMNTLSAQIVDLSNKDNRIRRIVHRRILEFIELALNSASDSSLPSLQMPTGLNILQDEILAITGEFVRFVSFNKSVFGEYYDQIIDDLIKNSA